MYNLKTFVLFISVLFISEMNAQNHLKLIQSFDSISLSEKTLTEANLAFSIIENAPIEFKNCKEVANNCENRAEFGNHVLKQLGFKPINFWIFKEGLIEGFNELGGLEYTSKTTDCKTLFWKYHVASGIVINTDQGLDTLIFDPWTQGKLVTLREWSLSFFKPNANRTVFAFGVLDNYYYFPTTNKGKLITTEDQWQAYVDKDSFQMFCGLCGITPNKKCLKSRHKAEIEKTRQEIIKYLALNNITI